MQPISSLGLLMRQITKRTFFPSCSSNAFVMYADEEFADAMESVGDAELAKGKMFHRIQIPENCHWRDVFAETKDIGQALKDSFRGIELANPKLHGIFGDASWTNKERLSDELLATLASHFNKVNLGVASVRDDDMGAHTST